ncbi:AMP-binding protein [Brucella intermedia]|uniref:AMP-binding protein n=1 Tax=Brucella intermedia TaxID=94625 RepID=UPI00320910AF
MNIANWLYQTSRAWPNRDAVLLGAEVVHTYGSLLQAIGNRVASLRKLAVKKGDRVAIYAKNCPEYFDVLHACWWIGAVVVPINCKLHVKEVQWIVENSRAAVIYTDTGSLFPGSGSFTEIKIAEPALAAGPTSAPEVMDDHDLAWLFYTSGTTGKPKGVMLSHANLRAMSLCYMANVDPAYATDAVLYAAPLSHGAGLYMFPHLKAGGAHLVPLSRGFDGDEIIDLATERGNLVIFAAPTMVKRLIGASRARGHDGSGIRTIIYGGGPMYLNDIEEAIEVYGPRFVQIYGQGETPMTISSLSRELVVDTTHPNCHKRRGSVGTAASAIEIRICGPHGEELRPGFTGEITVRGPSVMLGYWLNEEATRASIVDGWLRTGDLGHLDDDGFLYLTDRSKDVIISGGTNIYPREVEEAILTHPFVYEVAVVGEPEPEWGEQVVAHVVCAEGASVTSEELDGWCRDHIASFKKPKRYVFHKELPKNGYGKILKTDLRQVAPA